MEARDNERVESNTRNRYEVVDSLPPANKWSDREDELRPRTVPENVH